MSLSRPAPEVEVRVDDEVIPWIVAISAARSANGVAMDHAVLQAIEGSSDSPALTGKFSDMDALVGGKVTVDIFFEGQNQGWRIHSGRITQLELAFGAGRQMRSEYMLISRVEDEQFGQPLAGQCFCDKDGAVYLSNLPVVFNPIIDRVPMPNMREKPASDPTLPSDYHAFIDPESVANDKAIEVQGSDSDWWTIGKALHYLIWTCNGEQTDIENPTLEEVEDQIGEELAKTEIRNVKVPMLQHLPPTIDHFMQPFGLAWYLSQAVDRKPKLTIYRRGVGDRDRKIRMPKPITPLGIGDDELPNCDAKELSITFPYNESYNEIVGYGGFMTMESTWELYRAWPEDKDALRATGYNKELKKGTPEHAENEDVWRKWVLNEAGDYNGLRSDDATWTAKKVYDFSDDMDLLTDDQKDNQPIEELRVIRRRRFLPCNSRFKDGSPAGNCDGILIEYTNDLEVDQLDTESGKWKMVHAEVQILKRECGIVFTGEHVPQELLANVYTRIRVTACVQFDSRLFGWAKQRHISAYPEKRELFLDLGKRYKWRVTCDKTVNKKLVDAGTLETADGVEKKELEDYAKSIQDAWDVVSGQGPIVLEGLDRDYEIGDAITHIEGRDILLSIAAGEEKRSPVVSGIEYLIQRQEVRLVLEHFHAKQRKLARDSMAFEGPEDAAFS